MPYRLAIFDFDGTLADSFAWFAAAVNRAADRYGFRRIEPADVDALRGADARAVMRYIGLPAWKVPVVARYLRRQMGADVDRIRLFDGVGRVLEELAERRVALAVVSSNREATVRRVLGDRHAGLVAHYACDASVFGKRGKFRRVLRASGVAPGEAISIGDELRDLHASRAERIAFGAVTWGYTRGDALAAHGPEWVFAAVDQIVAGVTGV